MQPEVTESILDLVKCWRASRPKEGITVPVIDGGAGTGVSIHSLCEHAANLSEGVMTLVASGQHVQSVPLTRLTIECAATAVWLAVVPGAGKALEGNYLSQREKVFRKMDALGIEVGAEVLKRTLDDISLHTPSRRLQVIDLKSRCDTFVGGKDLYVLYCILSDYCHPGFSLVDVYLQQLETQIDGSDFAFTNVPQFSLERASYGMQMCMLALALKAWTTVADGDEAYSDLDTLIDAVALRHRFTCQVGPTSPA